MEGNGNVPRDLLFLSDLLLEIFAGVIPSIFAALADISGGASGGGDIIPDPWITADWRLECLLWLLVRFSETDLDLDNGGALLNMFESPLDIGDRSALSDEESFEEPFSSDDFLTDFERFKSESLDFFNSFAGEVSSDLRSLDDLFSSFRGAAPHAPQEEPSRTTRGRSFFEDDLRSGGVGGPAGSTFSLTGSLSLLLDLLFLLDFFSSDMSTISTISSSGRSGGKLPGTSFGLELFLGDSIFSSTISLSFLEDDLDNLDFFLSS